MCVRKIQMLVTIFSSQHQHVVADIHAKIQGDEGNNKKNIKSTTCITMYIRYTNNRGMKFTSFEFTLFLRHQSSCSFHLTLPRCLKCRSGWVVPCHPLHKGLLLLGGGAENHSRPLIGWNQSPGNVLHSGKAQKGEGCLVGCLPPRYHGTLKSRCTDIWYFNILKHTSTTCSIYSTFYCSNCKLFELWPTFGVQ